MPQTPSLSSRSVTTTTTLPVQIPDGDVNGTNLLFNVSGINGIVNHVELSFGFNPAHTWSGDVKAVLYSPNNTSHTLVDRIGETIVGGAGDSSDFAGPYTFTDQGGDFWTAAATTTSESVIPSGLYRTTSFGSATYTNMDSVFSGNGLNGRNQNFQGMDSQIANGVWRLNVADNAEGDTGSLNYAELTIFYSLATAANVSVSGRVTNGNSGIKNVTLMLYGGDLSAPIYVKTNDFGEYTFTDLKTNQIYVVSIISKKYRFSQTDIVLNLQSDVTDANFTAEE
ncbi:MAG TPA: hypothetical protein PKY59_20840 [Pyrinomonadaceae bacterium]|nr:hypothetical protein [Pyrinomonadaceae bacterium]